MFAADNPFLPQARLAARVLRSVAREPDLALKGGTAINFFFRDLPRLSVDLDLTYLRIREREESLSAIGEALERVAADVKKTLRGARVERRGLREGRIVVAHDRAQITVEVNTVLRGAVNPPLRVQAREPARDLFGDLEAQILSFEDCFAGKLVAALDRQHPRDLFDVAQLLAAEGLTRPLMDAFVVYLVSHGRPMSEVLAPVEKDLRQLHEAEFAKMTGAPVPVEALQEARARLVRELRQTLLPRHVQFLRSVKALDPDWALLPHAHVADLPAVRWRLQNLERFQKEQPQRYAAVRDRLEEVLKEFHGQ